jgi:hypothetical protein
LSSSPGIEQTAIEYSRRAVCDLIEFDAYFNGPQRFAAVDSAVMNILRMRVEILTEHMEALEIHSGSRCDIIAMLDQVSGACCDFLAMWGPKVLAFL